MSKNMNENTENSVRLIDDVDEYWYSAMLCQVGLNGREDKQNIARKTSGKRLR
jgi:hypothetical protein